MCGHCVAVCPKAAVSISGFDEPPAEMERPVTLEPDRLMDAIRTRRSIRQYKEKNFKNAPVAIVVVSKDKINASLAASNMELMAEAHGLGVLYSGFFARIANSSRKLRRLLKLTHAKAVTTLVPGYPNVKYRRTAQKDPAVVRHL